MRCSAWFATSLWFVACGGSPRIAASPPRVLRPLVAPRVFAGQLDAQVLFASTAAKATNFGAGPASIVAAGEVVEGERLGAFVDVPRDMCLLAYGRGSSSIDDIDIAAFTDEGNAIASDEAPDPRPTILFCPPHPDRVYLSAHTASGEGLVALGAQLVAPDRAVDVGHAVGARGGLGQGSRAEAWPGLDDHVRVHRDALGGKWEDFRKVAISVDSRAPTLIGFPVEADQCTDAVVVPDDDVALLDVEAMDDEGRILARAKEDGHSRWLTVCSPLAMNGSLSVRPHAGQGLAALVLGRAKAESARDLSQRPDVAWSASSEPLAGARATRNADLAQAGYPGPSSTVEGKLVLGRMASVALDFGKGAHGCFRVDVVGGAPVALVEGAIWDDAGALVATSRGSASATFFACGRTKARLDLETRGRPGPFAALVRPERWQNAAFDAHPLAAARMLTRAATGPSFLLEGAPVGVRSLAADGAHLVQFDETIAPGKCLRVSGGAEGEGTGLELRLFDTTTAEEIDRSHADRAVSVRACAPPSSSRAVHVQMRVTSGKLDVVIGERLL